MSVTKINLVQTHPYLITMQPKSTSLQVTDLISLFRPITMPLPAKDGRPGFEVQARPGAYFSASYDPSLAGLHPIQQDRIVIINMFNKQ